MKKRILNKRLAAIVASIRHGEMLFIADAGSGTSSKALYPLTSDVEYLELAAVTGSPSFQDVVSTLVEVGDFEGAIVTDVMKTLNCKDYSFLLELLGKENIHEMNYIPEYYEMRDRCKAVIQTGDYGIHAQAILIAGYPSDDIPMDWLKNGIKRNEA
ncbi:MAG: RbsD/FucU domain-containing protein [Gemmiger sp.]|uniref:RbsD/FucU domain-containing protein n=1 Tax=Gemmiger sp. TaxID=2049027 RepID=UPI002E76780C|nr:RbsD/FucU domain-containing protein [Gemmiger sp.]MEE0707902.1 RbsD/FucU domain-containing protein [Gemmiger sp.]